MCMFQACVPYFEILEKWIYKGIVADPYCEVSWVISPCILHKWNIGVVVSMSASHMVGRGLAS